MITIMLIMPASGVFSQQSVKQPNDSAFRTAEIQWSHKEKIPRDIKLKPSPSLNKTNFFSAYKKAFKLSDAHTFKPFKSDTEPSGKAHNRYKQYYKNIEIADVQYILHTENNQVYHAHGDPVHNLNIDVNPGISSTRALQLAYKYMSKSATVVTTQNFSQSGLSGLPLKPNLKSKLLITRPYNNEGKEKYQLVYRVEVLTSNPLGRYNVDINAHTGELVNQIPTMIHDNIQTKGLSLYNDTVEITISDSSYRDDWQLPSVWHLDDWKALGDTGKSWWMGNISLGTNGGYDNVWYEVLQTQPIELEGINPTLQFYHRYSVEPPENFEEYDGWDGMNVRISTDGGTTWEILENPVPAYNRYSLFSFGYQHGEGVGIPGWAGIQEEWQQVTINLNKFAGSTVQIRFAFASDPGYATTDEDPDLFGWQIDHIMLSNSTDTLFRNEGSSENMEKQNLYEFADFIEGHYRLRETTRGKGIATFNGDSIINVTEAVDFVENDSVITNQINKAGVSLHWGAAQTYDYFKEKHGRLSYDDQDGRIITYANVELEFESGTNPNNAAWFLGQDIAIFGPGDGITNNPFVSLDVVGHEIAHGVTDYAAGLLPINEPGGLNESFSDIFGTAIEFYSENEVGDWLMGEDFGIAGNVIRSMSNPKERANADTYLGEYWVSTDGTPAPNNDYGGVHFNCGVQNYWFYLLSDGGSGTNDNDQDYNVTGIGLESAANIAYRNLTTYLTPQSGFIDAAIYSRQSAIDLFGEESGQVKSVIDAWEAVGIHFGPSLATKKAYNIQMLVNQNINRSIQLKSAGTESLTIENITISGDDVFSINNLPEFPFDVMADDPYSFFVSFLPTNLRSYSAMLTITSNDTKNPVKTIELIGEGVNEFTTIDNTTIRSDQDGLLLLYPNPFSQQITIQFGVSETQPIEIVIVNSAGSVIKNLINKKFEKGVHEIAWDGTNANQLHVTPGNYYIWMKTRDHHFARPVTFQK
jgi:Zn-dependent metalloprotease